MIVEKMKCLVSSSLWGCFVGILLLCNIAQAAPISSVLEAAMNEEWANDGNIKQFFKNIDVMSRKNKNQEEVLSDSDLSRVENRLKDAVLKGLYADIPFNDWPENQPEDQKKGEGNGDTAKIGAGQNVEEAQVVFPHERATILTKLSEIYALLKRVNYFDDPDEDSQVVNFDKVRSSINFTSSLNMVGLAEIPDCSKLPSILGSCKTSESDHITITESGITYINFSNEFIKAFAQIALLQRLRRPVRVENKQGESQDQFTKVEVFKFMAGWKGKADTIRALKEDEQFEQLSLKEAWQVAGNSPELMAKFLPFYIEHLGGWSSLAEKLEGNTTHFFTETDESSGAVKNNVSAVLFLSVFNIFKCTDMDEYLAEHLKTILRVTAITVTSHFCQDIKSAYKSRYEALNQDLTDMTSSGVQLFRMKTNTASEIAVQGVMNLIYKRKGAKPSISYILQQLTVD